jgi:arylsulfatase A-like enzyme
MATMMDVLPTVASLAGVALPADRILDGHDLRPRLFGRSGVSSPYDETGFFYYHLGQLQAIRAGPWKLYLPLERKLANLRGDYSNAQPCPAALYDVRHDLGETREVSARHPEVVAKLLALADKARQDLGDWDRPGANQREDGVVENPTPRRLA